MSQQIFVRGSAPSRRGVSLVTIILIIAVLGGAIYGGLKLFEMNSGKPDPGGVKKTEAEFVKDTVDDLSLNLKAIDDNKADPAGVKEAIEKIKVLSEADLTSLKDQVSKATPAVKAQIVALIAAQLPKLQPLLDKAYAVPGVKEQLEPIVTKLMDGLKTLGV